MRKNLLACGLLCLLSVATIAKTNTQSPTVKGNWNPITIFNKTDKDIAYTIETFQFDNIYEIKKGRSDIYHSKDADEYATIRVGTCTRRENNQCVEYSLQNCVNNIHYNADHISKIEINSLGSCAVTCLDGTTTSCRQMGIKY